MKRNFFFITFDFVSYKYFHQPTIIIWILSWW